MPLVDWHETRDTLQLWTQIIGKIRMVNTPIINHWWNVPLYVSATGLTTSLIPRASGTSFQVDFDLQVHRLEIATVIGGRRSIPLQSGPVADFYAEVMHHLTELSVGTTWTMPVEIAHAIPIDTDTTHTVYNAEQAHRFWLALVLMVGVFEHFRSRFVGKSSPVHLFWGALDLATTRFSERPDRRTQEAHPNADRT